MTVAANRMGLVSVSAPFSSSSRTTASCPFTAARHSAVRPPLSFASTSAPYGRLGDERWERSNPLCNSFFFCDIMGLHVHRRCGCFRLGRLLPTKRLRYRDTRASGRSRIALRPRRLVLRAVEVPIRKKVVAILGKIGRRCWDGVVRFIVVAQSQLWECVVLMDRPVDPPLEILCLL